MPLSIFLEIAMLIDASSFIIHKDRIRQEFSADKIQKLADSIASLGLFHAVVVQNDEKTLIGGQRRLLAMKKLHEEGITFKYQGKPVPKNKIPAVTLGSLSSFHLKEAELHENIIREQISWQEKAAAIAELHKLRQEEAQKRGKKHTVRDTVREVKDGHDKGSYAKDVSVDLLVAPFLEDPEIKKAKTRKDALKYIEAKLTNEHRKRVAETLNTTSNTRGHRLIAGDMREILPKISKETFDCIISDPPYGINAHKKKYLNASAGHEYNDTIEYSNEIAETIFKEGFRITKKQAHLYMFCNINRFLMLRSMAEKVGWWVWETPFIWHKGTYRSTMPHAGYGPRRCYEAILYAIKGKKPAAPDRNDDVISITAKGGEHYGAVKPMEIYKELIERSCLSGESVLDPSCGTGNIFLAGDATRVFVTGIDINPTAIGACEEKLKNDL